MPKAAVVGVLENRFPGLIKSLLWGLLLELVQGLRVLLSFGGRRNRISKFKRYSEVSVAGDSVYNLRAGICFYGDGGLESGLASQWLL
jgi:hypothetical protein